MTSLRLKTRCKFLDEQMGMPQFGEEDEDDFAQDENEWSNHHTVRRVG